MVALLISFIASPHSLSADSGVVLDRRAATVLGYPRARPAELLQTA
jgi:hypothetical protein